MPTEEEQRASQEDLLRSLCLQQQPRWMNVLNVDKLDAAPEGANFLAQVNAGLGSRIRRFFS